jgi:hypothetical protein
VDAPVLSTVSVERPYQLVILFFFLIRVEMQRFLAEQHGLVKSSQCLAEEQASVGEAQHSRLLEASTVCVGARIMKIQGQCCSIAASGVTRMNTSAQMLVP